MSGTEHAKKEQTHALVGFVLVFLAGMGMGMGMDVQAQAGASYPRVIQLKTYAAGVVFAGDLRAPRRAVDLSQHR